MRSRAAGLGQEDSNVVITARILGDQVGSTAPVFLAFLAVHVLAGLTAVITGATAALVRKGSPRHIRAGRWYYRAITVVFATATVLAALRWRQDYYLFLIGAVAFTAATIGYQHRRRHRPGDTGHIVGMGTAYVAMLTAFYVNNGPHLPLWDHLPVITFWLLPSAWRLTSDAWPGRDHWCCPACRPEVARPPHDDLRVPSTELEDTGGGRGVQDGMAAGWGRA